MEEPNIYTPRFGGHILVNVSDSVAEFEARFRSQNAGGIFIYGDKFPYKEMLTTGVVIKAIQIAGHTDHIKDWTFLSLFKDVEAIDMVHDSSYPIDLSWFPNLKILIHRNCMYNAERTSVVTVLFYDFKSKAGDLTDLPLPNTVEELGFSKPNMKSLQGIERFANLRELTLTEAKSLVNVSSLASLEHLYHLNVGYSPKIDFDNFPYLPKLTYLHLTKSTLKSTKFIQNLPNLNHFVTNATIEDNDLTPFKGRKWDRLFFKPAKLYQEVLPDISVLP